MKKINILFVVLCLFTIKPMNVYANTCSEEKTKEYEEKAKQVEITYEYVNDLIDANNEVINGFFRIYVNGLNDDMMVYNPERSLIILAENGKEIEKFGYTSGNYTFEISTQNVDCKKVYRTIEIKLPRYNEYSDSYLCNDIDASEFLLCGKWYEYEVDEATFKLRLEEYKKQKEKENATIIENVEETIETTIENVVDNVKTSWYWYLLGIILIIIIVSIIIFIKKKNKKENDKWR